MSEYIGPDRIPEPLMKALGKQDFQAFERFCQEHEASIFENFSHWRRVPEHVRQDPQAANNWANAIMNIARYFEAQGKPELWELLVGKSADNPLVRWQDGAAEARRLNEEGSFAQSNTILTAILSEMEGASGGFIDEYRPKIYGLLGVNFFNLGDIEMAQQYTQLALQECERLGDEEGAGIYRDNLKSLLASYAAELGAAGEHILHVRAEIAKAQDLSDGLAYRASNRMLLELIKKYSAGELEGYLPKIYGLLGSNYHRLDELDEAQEYTRLAVEESRSGRDPDGVRIYQANLKVIERKKGTPV